MTHRITERLKRLLQERAWVKGAVNFDEDLHFSTYYLRASCATQTGSLYPGYSTVAAFYSGFNESYYLLKDECQATAAAIVAKALRRPDWLDGVLAAIHRRSDRLGRLFAADTSPARLAGWSDRRLLALFRRHAIQQRSLYRAGRLPEALDRGVSYFTEFLKDHLRRLGVLAGDVDEVFAVLSQPSVPSVLSQEILEFDAIVHDARSHPAAAPNLAWAGGRARLVLNPHVLARLDAHRGKWQFLHYHGYGRRELATPGQYLARFTEQTGRPPCPAGAADMQQRFHDAAAARQQALGRLRLDPPHRRLFDIYPKIGAAKLYRRHAQLRNFYYLDMLLAEIARRLGVAEGVVRSMLPEEIDLALRDGRPVARAVHERIPDCLFAILGDREHVLGGQAARELAQLFQERTKSPSSGSVLRGVVASRGKVVGRCRVIIRADDVDEALPPGTIIVSESTDPDLLGLLRQAAGVLTEQGGVTAHAAIICRELGVPTIIGIDGLLERIHDGDLVEVDAMQGTVTLRHDAAANLNGHAAPLGSAEVIGAKAHHLGLVRSLGFHVPDFVVLLFDAVRRAVEGSEGTDLVRRLVATLGLADNETLALRSSAVGEDGATGSLAGDFHSLLDVPVTGLAEGLRSFVRHNRSSKGGQPYRGGVIVQRMIAADCGGVCLTRDARTGHGDAVIVEAVAGGNASVTAGTAAPDRFVVDRLTGDILEAERRCVRLGAMPLDVAGLVRQFLTLEERFGKPLDIEWALRQQKLYILQARPIVHRATQGRGRTIGTPGRRRRRNPTRAAGQ